MLRNYKILTILTLLPISVGCAQSNPATSSMIQSVPDPQYKPFNNYEWIKRLKATAPIETSVVMNGQVSLPIPVPASADSRYSILVNHQASLAWLQSTNGINGPWSLNQPDVVHILNSLSQNPHLHSVSAATQ